MFAGFRSRCMILFLCMWSSAPASCLLYSQISGSLKRESFATALRIRRFRSPFSAHSTMIKRSLLSMSELRSLTMFGWSSDCSRRTSFKHFSRCFGTIISKILIFFIAHSRPSERRFAMYTMENLPLPKGLTISYPWTTWPGCRMTGAGAPASGPSHGSSAISTARTAVPAGRAAGSAARPSADHRLASSDPPRHAGPTSPPPRRGTGSPCPPWRGRPPPAAYHCVPTH
mmetsp:Transcript_57688/g.163835  ORF Transcript_57688/g.163835 Transcript_57688/m.163835 type:complete len:229 (+) Transcript_57688:1596-2282(+)